MGSGLILLVIVGAWLAVLVPMALRSHDVHTSMGTVDRFHDAMRVLSRRPSDVPVEVEPDEAAPAPLPPAITPAQRRVRALAALVGIALVTLLGGLVGPTWVLGLHFLTDLLIAGFVVWLRRQALRRAERAVPAPVRVARPARRALPLVLPGRVVGIPDRIPSRVAVTGDMHVRVSPALVSDDAVPVPARGAQGEPWQPVPVPVPMYVNAPTAPRRVVDLTSGDRVIELDQQINLDEGLERRRAVGD